MMGIAITEFTALREGGGERFKAPRPRKGGGKEGRAYKRDKFDRKFPSEFGGGVFFRPLTDHGRKTAWGRVELGDGVGPMHLPQFGLTFFECLLDSFVELSAGPRTRRRSAMGPGRPV